MSLARLVYNAALHTVGYAAVKVVRGPKGEDDVFWAGRYGHYELEPPEPRQPTLWFHAASVGEVAGAIPTLRESRRAFAGARLVLSVGTPTGYRSACSRVPDGVHVVPYPLDFPLVIDRALKAIRANVFVAFESEFWPNLFNALQERSVPAVLLNGRLSDRSLRRYLALRPLFGPVFQHFRWLAMSKEADRRNVLAMGVEEDRALVLGTSKHDGLFERVDHRALERWRSLLSLPPGVPVVVGGSLRRSECHGLLRVFRDLLAVAPSTVGLFAPRHLERIPSMVQWLEARGIPFQLFSQLEAGGASRNASVVLVDRIGVLFELYGLGDLVFCGGTFEPIGGHNILEPAAWGKSVFYGPNIQKVLEEHRALEAKGAGFLVRNEQELLSRWMGCVSDLEAWRARGIGGREAVRSLSGVAARQVGLIEDVLRGTIDSTGRRERGRGRSGCGGG